jgi:hypothetical protein
MATATSSRQPPAGGSGHGTGKGPARGRRRVRPALAVTAIAAAAAAAAAAVALAGGSPGRAFRTLAPAPAPAGWHTATLPNRAAMLSYPPSMRPLAGDRDAVSVAERGPSGAFRLYLNATPRQGAETLPTWAGFRLRLLRADDAATARLDAAQQGVRFRGGTGSCVLDDYRTRIGAHHYTEIACLVQGHTAASVIVAAAPAANWAQARPLLMRAIAAYQVR